MGQWAASRTDIFPQEMCIRLSKLHSAVDPHPFHETKRVIEKAFNRPFEEIFINFDMDPIGIGAIAQARKKNFIFFLDLIMNFQRLIK